MLQIWAPHDVSPNGVALRKTMTLLSRLVSPTSNTTRVLVYETIKNINHNLFSFAQSAERGRGITA